MIGAKCVVHFGVDSAEDEKTLLAHLQREHPINQLKAVVDGAELLEFQKQVWEVHVDDTLREYIIRFVAATRSHPDLALGASPRASLAVFKTAQALAFLRGRDHVLPDDIKYLIPYTLVHRLIVNPEAELRGRNAHSLVDNLLGEIPLNLGELDA